MKKDSKESIEKQISHYTAKHRQADEELVFERRRRIPDQLKVSRLKKLKLMCKDKLSELSEQLQHLSKPKRPPADVIPLPTPQPAAVMEPTRLAASG